MVAEHELRQGLLIGSARVIADRASDGTSNEIETDRSVGCAITLAGSSNSLHGRPALELVGRDARWKPHGGRC